MTKHPFTKIVAINIASAFLFTTIVWAAPPTSQSRGLRGIPNSKIQITNVIPAKAGIQKEIPHQVRDDNNPRTRELANSRTESILSHYAQSNALRMNQFSDTGAVEADKAIHRIAKQKGIAGIGPVLALSGVLTLFLAAVVFGGNYSPQIVDSFGNSDLALAVKDSLAQFQSMAADSVSAAADIVQNADALNEPAAAVTAQTADTVSLFGKILSVFKMVDINNPLHMLIISLLAGGGSIKLLNYGLVNRNDGHEIRNGFIAIATFFGLIFSAGGFGYSTLQLFGGVGAFGSVFVVLAGILFYAAASADNQQSRMKINIPAAVTTAVSSLCFLHVIGANPLGYLQVSGVMASMGAFLFYSSRKPGVKDTFRAGNYKKASLWFSGISAAFGGLAAFGKPLISKAIEAFTFTADKIGVFKDAAAEWFSAPSHMLIGLISAAAVAVGAGALFDKYMKKDRFVSVAYLALALISVVIVFAFFPVFLIDISGEKGLTTFGISTMSGCLSACFFILSGSIGNEEKQNTEKRPISKSDLKKIRVLTILGFVFAVGALGFLGYFGKLVIDTGLNAMFASSAGRTGIIHASLLLPALFLPAGSLSDNRIQSGIRGHWYKTYKMRLFDLSIEDIYEGLLKDEVLVRPANTGGITRRENEEVANIAVKERWDDRIGISEAEQIAALEIINKESRDIYRMFADEKMRRYLLKYNLIKKSDSNGIYVFNNAFFIPGFAERTRELFNKKFGKNKSLIGHCGISRGNIFIDYKQNRSPKDFTRDFAHELAEIIRTYYIFGVERGMSPNEIAVQLDSGIYHNEIAASHRAAPRPANDQEIIEDGLDFTKIRYARYKVGSVDIEMPLVGDADISGYLANMDAGLQGIMDFAVSMAGPEVLKYSDKDVQEQLKNIRSFLGKISDKNLNIWKELHFDDKTRDTITGVADTMLQAVGYDEHAAFNKDRALVTLTVGALSIANVLANFVANNSKFTRPAADIHEAPNLNDGAIFPKYFMMSPAERRFARRGEFKAFLEKEKMQEILDEFETKEIFEIIGQIEDLSLPWEKNQVRLEVIKLMPFIKDKAAYNLLLKYFDDQGIWSSKKVREAAAIEMMNKERAAGKDAQAIYGHLYYLNKKGVWCDILPQESPEVQSTGWQMNENEFRRLRTLVLPGEKLLELAQKAAGHNNKTVRKNAKLLIENTGDIIEFARQRRENRINELAELNNKVFRRIYDKAASIFHSPNSDTHSKKIKRYMSTAISRTFKCDSQYERENLFWPSFKKWHNGFFVEKLIEFVIDRNKDPRKYLNLDSDFVTAILKDSAAVMRESGTKNYMTVLIEYFKAVSPLITEGYEKGIKDPAELKNYAMSGLAVRSTNIGGITLKEHLEVANKAAEALWDKREKISQFQQLEALDKIEMESLEIYHMWTDPALQKYLLENGIIERASNSDRYIFKNAFFLDGFAGMTNKLFKEVFGIDKTLLGHWGPSRGNIMIDSSRGRGDSDKIEDFAHEAGEIIGIYYILGVKKGMTPEQISKTLDTGTYHSEIQHLHEAAPKPSNEGEVIADTYRFDFTKIRYKAFDVAGSKVTMPVLGEAEIVSGSQDEGVETALKSMDEELALILEFLGGFKKPLHGYSEYRDSERLSPGIVKKAVKRIYDEGLLENIGITGKELDKIKADLDLIHKSMETVKSWHSSYSTEYVVIANTALLVVNIANTLAAFVQDNSRFVRGAGIGSLLGWGGLRGTPSKKSDFTFDSSESALDEIHRIDNAGIDNFHKGLGVETGFFSVKKTKPGRGPLGSAIQAMYTGADMGYTEFTEKELRQRRVKRKADFIDEFASTIWRIRLTYKEHDFLIHYVEKNNISHDKIFENLLEYREYLINVAKGEIDINPEINRSKQEAIQQYQMLREIDNRTASVTHGQKKQAPALKAGVDVITLSKSTVNNEKNDLLALGVIREARNEDGSLKKRKGGAQVYEWVLKFTEAEIDALPAGLRAALGGSGRVTGDVKALGLQLKDIYKKLRSNWAPMILIKKETLSQREIEDIAGDIQSGCSQRYVIVTSKGDDVFGRLNKFKGVRAALCHDEKSAEMTRNHNNANALIVPALFTTPAQRRLIIDAFMNTEFSEKDKADRHTRRINKIDNKREYKKYTPEPEECSKGPGDIVIAVGSDHGAFDLKNKVAEYYGSKGFKVVDVGTYTDESCDYPDFAQKIAKGIDTGAFTHGVMLCTTGIGANIAISRGKKTNPVLCRTADEVRTVANKDTNVLGLGAMFVDPEGEEFDKSFKVKEMLDAFIEKTVPAETVPGFKEYEVAVQARLAAQKTGVALDPEVIAAMATDKKTAQQPKKIGALTPKERAAQTKVLDFLRKRAQKAAAFFSGVLPKELPVTTETVTAFMKEEIIPGLPKEDMKELSAETREQLETDFNRQTAKLSEEFFEMDLLLHVYQNAKEVVENANNFNNAYVATDINISLTRKNILQQRHQYKSTRASAEQVEEDMTYMLRSYIKRRTAENIDNMEELELVKTEAMLIFGEEVVKKEYMDIYKSIGMAGIGKIFVLLDEVENTKKSQGEETIYTIAPEQRQTAQAAVESLQSVLDAANMDDDTHNDIQEYLETIYSVFSNKEVNQGGIFVASESCLRLHAFFYNWINVDIFIEKAESNGVRIERFKIIHPELGVIPVSKAKALELNEAGQLYIAKNRDFRSTKDWDGDPLTAAEVAAQEKSGNTFVARADKGTPDQTSKIEPVERYNERQAEILSDIETLREFRKYLDKISDTRPRVVDFDEFIPVYASEDSEILDKTEAAVKRLRNNLNANPFKRDKEIQGCVYQIVGYFYSGNKQFNMMYHDSFRIWRNIERGLNYISDKIESDIDAEAVKVVRGDISSIHKALEWINSTEVGNIAHVRVRESEKVEMLLDAEAAIDNLQQHILGIKLLTGVTGLSEKFNGMFYSCVDMELSEDSGSLNVTIYSSQLIYLPQLLEKLKQLDKIIADFAKAKPVISEQAAFVGKQQDTQAEALFDADDATRTSDKVFVTRQRHEKMRKWLAEKWEAGEVKIDAELSNKVKAGYMNWMRDQGIYDKDNLEAELIEYLKNKGHIAPFTEGKPIKSIQMALVNDMQRIHGHADHEWIRGAIGYMDERVFNILVEKYGQARAEKLWVEFGMHVYGELINTYSLFKNRAYHKSMTLEEFAGYLDDHDNQKDVKTIIKSIHDEAPPVPAEVKKIIKNIEVTEGVLKEYRALEIEDILNQGTYNLFGESKGRMIWQGEGAEEIVIEGKIKFLNDLNWSEDDIDEGDILVANIPIFYRNPDTNWPHEKASSEMFEKVIKRVSVVVLGKDSLKYSKSSRDEVTDLNEITERIKAVNPTARVVGLSTLDMALKIKNIVSGSNAKYTCKGGRNFLIINPKAAKASLIRETHKQIETAKKRLGKFTKVFSRVNHESYTGWVSYEEREEMFSQIDPVGKLLYKFYVSDRSRESIDNKIEKFHQSFKYNLFGEQPITEDDLKEAKRILEHLKSVVDGLAVHKYDITRPAAKEEDADLKTSETGKTTPSTDETAMGVLKQLYKYTTSAMSSAGQLKMNEHPTARWQELSETKRIETVNSLQKSLEGAIEALKRIDFDDKEAFMNFLIKAKENCGSSAYIRGIYGKLNGALIMMNRLMKKGAVKLATEEKTAQTDGDPRTDEDVQKQLKSGSTFVARDVPIQTGTPTPSVRKQMAAAKQKKIEKLTQDNSEVFKEIYNNYADLLDAVGELHAAGFLKRAIRRDFKCADKNNKKREQLFWPCFRIWYDDFVLERLVGYAVKDIDDGGNGLNLESEEVNKLLKTGEFVHHDYRLISYFGRVAGFIEEGIASGKKDAAGLKAFVEERLSSAKELDFDRIDRAAENFIKIYGHRGEEAYKALEAAHAVLADCSGEELSLIQMIFYDEGYLRPHKAMDICIKEIEDIKEDKNLYFKYADAMNTAAEEVFGFSSRVREPLKASEQFDRYVFALIEFWLFLDKTYTEMGNSDIRLAEEKAAPVIKAIETLDALEDLMKDKNINIENSDFEIDSSGFLDFVRSVKEDLKPDEESGDFIFDFGKVDNLESTIYSIAQFSESVGDEFEKLEQEDFNEREKELLDENREGFASLYGKLVTSLEERDGAEGYTVMTVNDLKRWIKNEFKCNGETERVRFFWPCFQMWYDEFIVGELVEHAIKNIAETEKGLELNSRFMFDLLKTGKIMRIHRSSPLADYCGGVIGFIHEGIKNGRKDSVALKDYVMRRLSGEEIEQVDIDPTQEQADKITGQVEKVIGHIGAFLRDLNKEAGACRERPRGNLMQKITEIISKLEELNSEKDTAIAVTGVIKGFTDIKSILTFDWFSNSGGFVHYQNEARGKLRGVLSELKAVQMKDVKKEIFDALKNGLRGNTCVVDPSPDQVLGIPAPSVGDQIAAQVDIDPTQADRVSKYSRAVTAAAMDGKADMGWIGNIEQSFNTPMETADVNVRVITTSDILLNANTMGDMLTYAVELGDKFVVAVSDEQEANEIRKMVPYALIISKAAMGSFIENNSASVSLVLADRDFSKAVKAQAGKQDADSRFFYRDVYSQEGQMVVYYDLFKSLELRLKEIKKAFKAGTDIKNEEMNNRLQRICDYLNANIKKPGFATITETLRNTLKALVEVGGFV